jgi:RNA polymerase sigma-70 factor (ECF subfamily)
MRRAQENEVPALVESARNGDQTAIGQLTKLYRADVKQHLSRFAPEAAEDLTQEVFMNLTRSLRGYSESGRFREWLRAVAYNRFRTWLRSEVRKGLETLHTNAFGVSKETTTLFHTAKQKLRAVVTELPDGEREAWELYVRGYSPKEIAQELGISSGAASTRLSRAKDRLEELIIARLDPD